MATLDRDNGYFERKLRALGAHVQGDGRQIGEFQADTIMELHRTVNWFIQTNPLGKNADTVFIYDLRHETPKYLLSMIRDHQGVWTQINGPDATEGFAGTQTGPDGVLLDPDVWSFLDEPDFVQRQRLLDSIWRKIS